MLAAMSSDGSCFKRWALLHRSVLSATLRPASQGSSFGMAYDAATLLHMLALTHSNANVPQRV